MFPILLWNFKHATKRSDVRNATSGNKNWSETHTGLRGKPNHRSLLVKNAKYFTRQCSDMFKVWNNLYNLPLSLAIKTASTFGRITGNKKVESLLFFIHLAHQVQLQWHNYDKQAGTARLKPALK